MFSKTTKTFQFKKLYVVICFNAGITSCVLYQMTDDNWDMVKGIFEAMNVELTAVMRRYTSQGSFAIWDTSKPSVWLTAWVIRNLESVAFQVCHEIIFKLNEA
jgi:hypothetical protein